MKKSLFNFYLDDNVKEQVQNKLLRLTGDKPKGQIAALIRVLLNVFAQTPDEKINPLLIQAIEAEYEYSQKLNKRSNM
jgi:hypothetical protein